jgi:hypothetical protein
VPEAKLPIPGVRRLSRASTALLVALRVYTTILAILVIVAAIRRG